MKMTWIVIIFRGVSFPQFTHLHSRQLLRLQINFSYPTFSITLVLDVDSNSSRCSWQEKIRQGGVKWSHIIFQRN